MNMKTHQPSDHQYLKNEYIVWFISSQFPVHDFPIQFAWHAHMLCQKLFVLLKGILVYANDTL